MSWLHYRWRRRLGLLASGVLEGEEEAGTQAHVDACPACARELAELRAVVETLARDPAREAEPAIPLGALRARVLARLDAPASSPAAPRRVLLASTFAAAVAAALALVTLWPRAAALPPPERAAASPAPDPAADADEFVRRLERVAAREQAARYLGEAGDVLVTVAARPRRCRKGHDHVDIGEEAERSRELLARRSLLDVDAAAVVSAKPVLDDVEQVLREVASLEACARRNDLRTIQQQVERRRLLLKIDLMTRELQG
jgi:hypothetical protein